MALQQSLEHTISREQLSPTDSVSGKLVLTCRIESCDIARGPLYVPGFENEGVFAKWSLTHEHGSNPEPIINTHILATID